MESLYRKYRPLTFDDVVGQHHVVSTLKRAVVENKTSHAYLFCGPRGTGKTTLARILAKALICQKGEHQLPDGTCENCRLIAAGNHPDVYELDAASRTGVDNVREEIISRIDYAPIRGPYKVYIIDEVHMLTPAAFNALLKTLEEPPSHVTFIMCTTDPQKILETILSRVQRFDFHAIDAKEIAEHLGHICAQEEFSFEEPALDSIAHHARGSMRDALSTLEQLSVFCNGTITLEATHDLLGEVAACELSTLVHAAASRDVPALFAEVARHVTAGHNLLQLTQSLLRHLRDVYVISAIGPQKGIIAGTTEELAAYKAEADAFGNPNRIARMITILSDTTATMRTTPNQQLALELALTRITRPESDVTLESLQERVEALERIISSQTFSTPVKESEPAEATAAVETAAATTAATVAATATAETAAAATAETTETAAAATVETTAAATVETTATVAATAAAAAETAAAAATATAETAAAATVATAATAAAAVETTAAAETAATPHDAIEKSANVLSEYDQVPNENTFSKDHGYEATSEAPATAQKFHSQAQQTATPEQPVTTTTDAGELQRAWHKVVDKLIQTEPACGSLLAGTTATADDGRTLVITLAAENTFVSRMLERSDIGRSIDQVVAQVMGRRSLVYNHNALASPAKNTAMPYSEIEAPEAPSKATPPAPPVPEASKQQQDVSKISEQSSKNPFEKSTAPESIPTDSPDDFLSTPPAPSSAPPRVNNTEFDELARLAEGIFGNAVSISTSQAPDSNNQ